MAFTPPTTLVIAGASGLVGSALQRQAAARYQLRCLTRNRAKVDNRRWFYWNPAAIVAGNHSALEALSEVLSGADALLNLAGSPIAAGRLNKAHQQKILSSRLESTAALLAAQRRAAAPVAAWLQTSAVGFYGDRGDALLTENVPAGEGILPAICQAWEAAAEDAGGARLMVTRLGVVLDAQAEAWQKLVTPVRLGVGGPLGSGQQWFPWIVLEDVAAAMLYLLEHESAEGIYNFCAPEALRQIDLSRQLAQKLSRPAVVPAPAAALRLALGKLADELILASMHCSPARLLAAGYTFKYATLDAALAKLLK